MPKRKLCGAPTLKGRGCRNPSNPNTGVCALHATNQRRPTQAAVASTETLPRIDLTLTTTVEGIGETIVDIPEAIRKIIRIVEFVGNHWPQIHHLARHRVLKPKPNAAANLIKDCERMIESGHKDANLAARFERWFESLPITVKEETEIEFGDIRAIERVLRNSSA